MFLGNLSTTTERKTRKDAAGKGNKKKTDSESSNEPAASGAPSGASSTSAQNPLTKVSAGGSTTGSGMKRVPKGELPILYDADRTDIPREHMLSYFRTVTEMMVDESNVADMVEEQLANGKGLHEVAANFQRDVLEQNFQIERKWGCQYMSMLPHNFPQDKEMIRIGKEFTDTAIRSYVLCLEYRSRTVNCGVLRKDGGMGRLQMIEFFEGCNAVSFLPETKAELKELFLRTKQSPGPKLVEKQREIIKLIGLDPDYGVSLLNRVSSDFGDDQDLLNKMHMFALAARLACNEASMSDEQREQFYGQIPPFMHSFPQVYVFQQQMVAQQRQMQMQQQGRAGASGPGGNPMQSIPGDNPMVAQQAKIRQFMNTEEGRSKVATVTERIGTAKVRCAEKIKGWNGDKRKTYFDSLKDSPIHSMLGDERMDVQQKFENFLTMPEGDLDDLLTMQLVLADDIQSGGKLIQELTHGDSPMARSFMTNMHAMRSLAGGLAGGVGAAAAAEQGHVHSAACQHGNKGASKPPDVTSGKADVMDR